jgi:hypothetical protein
VGGALAWAEKEYKLQILPIAPEEKAKWDALLKPMVDEWVVQMSGKGLPAEKYVTRLRELRDEYAKQYK